ncbi:hypothetical protein MMC09_001734 [Bachmanniomyces sp. S44760]|nr:hypothetical protein [Bachmanniomyces sp. S44760]
MRTRTSRRNGKVTNDKHPRNARSRVSYQEPPSDISEAETIETVPETVGSSRKRRPEATCMPMAKKPNHTGRQRRAQILQPRRIRSTTSSLNAGSKEQDMQDVIKIESDGKIPAWTTLPYEILWEIFYFASHPLLDGAYAPTGAVRWLSRTALTCKAFAEPALSKLYYEPPLAPTDRVYRLRDALQSQSSSSTYDYRNKVKYLTVSAYDLSFKHDKQDPIDLADFISILPRLRGIDIHTGPNVPLVVSRTLGERLRQSIYKDSMFDALGDHGISLLRWKWDWSLMTSDFLSTNGPVVAHHVTPFHKIEDLSVVKYTNARDGTELGNTLAQLPELKRLTIRSSPTTDMKFLGNITQELESLEISECGYVTSAILQKFLTQRGRRLRVLILNHNQSLELSFLQDLADDCPELEVLLMNLTYHNTYSTFSDSEPRFAEILGTDQLPTWPTKLQNLELLHLRKWRVEAAEMLFRSLLESANSLRYLRKLVLKASIEIGWRDRAAFRDKWIGKLQKVFLRKSPPPNAHLCSLKAFREYKMHEGNDTEIGSDSDVPLMKGQTHLRKGLSKQFSHVEIVRASNDSESGEDSSTLPNRRSRRIKRINQEAELSEGKHESGNTSSGSDDGENRDEVNEENSDKILQIQGLCNVVDIRIDNLRPTEEQLNENDFLDEEASGDEDWNGDDDLPGQEGYAW